MPRPRHLPALAVVAVAFAVAAYLLLRPTDESRIRSQLDRLAAAIRVTEADAQGSPVGRLAHVNGDLERLFEPDVRMSMPEVTSVTSGRAELAELVAGAPRFVRTFDVDFTNVTIKLDQDRTTALVGATAKMKLTDRDGSASQERRAVDLRFVRKDGAWFIRSLTVWTKEDAAPG